MHTLETLHNYGEQLIIVRKGGRTNVGKRASKHPLLQSASKMDRLTCGLIHCTCFHVCHVVYRGAIKSSSGEANASLLNCYLILQKDKYEQNGALQLHIHRWLV